jgi:hypothetical protein
MASTNDSIAYAYAISSKTQKLSVKPNICPIQPPFNIKLIYRLILSIRFSKNKTSLQVYKDCAAL